MVLICVKKKVSINMTNELHRKIMNRMNNFKLKKEYLYKRNPMSNILIHLYCKNKGIISPFENFNESKILNRVKPFIEKIKNKKVATYSLSEENLLIRLLLKKYNTCNIKEKCILCRPVKYFIKNTKINNQVP